MEYNKVASQFGTWGELFRPFIESKSFDDIFTYLKMMSQDKKVIIPKSEDVFKSFLLTDRHRLKSLMFLMCPYATLTREGKMIANGVPVDCSNTGVAQPSLSLLNAAIEQDYIGFDPEFDNRNDLSYLMREEGIMLVNTSLTVEALKVNSHDLLWQPFMQFFIQQVLCKYYKGLPVILCGQTAQKLERYFTPMLHYIIKCEHMAAASYANRLWDNQNCFKKADEIIRQNNGESEVPRWYRLKSDAGATPPPEWATDGTIQHNDYSVSGGQEIDDMPF